MTTHPKSPKKSETLEVRIPYPTKTAFMEKARAEGRAASEIVRESIDAYLLQESGPETLADKAAVMIRRNLHGAGLLLAGAGSAIAISLMASPASAVPAMQVGGGGTLPLTIVVDLPEGGLTASQLGELVGRAFARLDSDADGILGPGEADKPDN